MNDNKKSPVLLLTYRKEEFLDEILTAISDYQPPILYIFQNKENNIDETKLVSKVKSKIKNFNYQTAFIYYQHALHLDINTAIQTAINTVFEKEEQLIVIEDDVIPNQSFFKFCNSMLAKYRHDENIGCINGCNLNTSHKMNQYYLSGISLPYWGWATWKSKWELHKHTVIPWEKRATVFLPYISQANRDFFEIFFGNLKNESPTWDIQWNWVLLLNNQSTIIPGINLITNKGFSPKGTYTTYSKSKFKKMKRYDFDRTKPLLLSSYDKDKVSYEKNSSYLLQEIINRNNKEKNLLSLFKNWIRKK